LFIFALIWSIGATTDSDGREKFSNWLKNKITENQIMADFTDSDQVYNYEYILTTN
jgi:dynein heavy chain